MRVLFIGATKLGLLCCEEIAKQSVICGVVSSPQKFSISYSKSKVKNVQHADFKSLAGELEVPYFETQEGMKSDACVEFVRNCNPDLIVVIGWYYMVPKNIRDIPRFGAVGIHASLLPKYSGGAPLVWAIIEGETETGVTLFYLDKGIDSGDIIAQRRITITDDDTIKTVYDKAEQASIEIVAKYIPLLGKGAAPRIKQDESKRAIYPQRSPEDGKIDWSWDVRRIRNFIRAQTKPYPGAFTIIDGKKVTIWSADIEEYEK